MVNRTKFIKTLTPVLLTFTFLFFQNCSWQFKTTSDFADLPSSISNIGNIGTGGGGSVISSPTSAYSLTKALSREESLSAVRDIVGANLVPDSFLFMLPQDEKTAGFESASVKIFNEGFVRGRLEFSESVASAALRSPQVMTCYPGYAENTPWAGCVQTIVTQFARRAFSRAPTNEELTEWQNLYQSTARAVLPFLSSTLLGNLDTVGPNLLAQGWSLDPQWSDRPIQIHFYVNGPAGTGTFAGSTITRIARPDVISFFAQSGQGNYTGLHGFSFQLPTQFGNGQNHTLHAYAIGSNGTTGANNLIGTVNFQANNVGQISNATDILSVSTRESLRNVFTAILMSPSFILREPPQLATEPLANNQNRRLARKLALFISGTLPDNELMQVSESGEITNPQVLRAQAIRLLDRNMNRFVSNSFGQWFGFRDFSRVSELTSVERAMITESQMVFEELLRQEYPVESILMPGFTFLNQELASNYGIPGVNSNQFIRVNQAQRGGVLTQGSVLRLTSPTADTKVIQRGKWIMSNLLCQIIPLPDNGLREDAIANSVDQLPPNASVKETLAFHRSTGPACYNCHKQMDPLGLSLEVFDSFGRLRSTYPDMKPVEADGDLNGVPFNGPYELAPIIAQQQFKSCVARKLLTHGLGRTLASADDSVTLGLSASSSLRDMVLRIVTSQAFINEARRNQ